MVAAPMMPIARVDVMRRTLLSAAYRVVSEMSALRGNSVEIAAATEAPGPLGDANASCERPTHH